MTAAETAHYLSCSVSTVRRMVQRGDIPHYKLSKLIRFRRSEIDAWLALHHEGEIPAEQTRDVAPHPDQLFLFGRDIGATA
ncbi:MAG: helix-turn-helix domain-containing protein [Gemmatimonadetes bacterium]|nr:helix-turn-helix domain-containing protein [Gemmatimonadota bacterium]MBT7864278.1 helix-turn-helix domain-containing protein [Gemmatimonadota bacterium]